MTEVLSEPLVQFVICIRCGTEHTEHPAEREGLNKDQVLVMGVWAKDYTYYRDNYKNKGFGVLCNRHDRDSISNVTEKEIVKSYDYDKHQ